MNDARVLVVDDEPQIIRFLTPALNAAGYEMIEAATGITALRLLTTHAPDVVILDLGLPDLDGKDVISRIRAFSDIPIIVLSARDREIEKISALDIGADDYVEKPFKIGELLARIRTALRHNGKKARPIERICSLGLTIDFIHRTIERNGQPIRLTPKEYDLLEVMARNSGRVLTHKNLLTAIWGPAHVNDTQYLRVFIGQLRAKIEDNADKPLHIQTESGVGYRFNDAA